MKLIAHIITYNRREMCEALVDELRRQYYGITIHVWNDGGPVPVGAKGKAIVHDMPHRGRRFFWSMWRDIIRATKRMQFDYCLFLPDDIVLVEGAIDKALATFKAIDDPDKVALNMSVDSRGHCMQWVAKKPTKVGGVWLTRWFDGCGLVNHAFFAALSWQIGRVPHSHFGRNESSGVGAQISKRLDEKGCNVYQVDETLTIHGDHASKMHPQHRKEVPL